MTTDPPLRIDDLNIEVYGNYHRGYPKKILRKYYNGNQDTHRAFWYLTALGIGFAVIPALIYRSFLPMAYAPLSVMFTLMFTRYVEERFERQRSDKRLAMLSHPNGYRLDTLRDLKNIFRDPPEGTIHAFSGYSSYRNGRHCDTIVFVFAHEEDAILHRLKE